MGGPFPRIVLTPNLSNLSGLSNFSGHLQVILHQDEELLPLSYSLPKCVRLRRVLRGEFCLSQGAVYKSERTLGVSEVRVQLGRSLHKGNCAEVSLPLHDPLAIRIGLK